ncbi:MAG: AMP-binding protein [Acidiferrobacterales bacterium]|nr:AMP-binding protein [Acidiferrobacterales bacterium]
MSHDIWNIFSPRLKSNAPKTAWIRRQRDAQSLSYTYGMVHQSALHMAARLREHGVSQGDVVSVIGPNGIEWGVAAFAAWRVGAILAPVHIGYSEEDIRTQITALSPKLIMAHEADSKLSGVDTPQIAIEITSELSAAEEQVASNNLSSEEAVRIYTSGSTGSPKIVRLSHRNLSSNVIACSKIVEIDHNDRFLSLLPLSHTFEMVGGMLLPLYCGSSIALPKVLTAQEVLAAMAEENVSVVLAVPRLYRNIKRGMEQKFHSGSFLLRGYVSLLGALPMSLRTRLNAPLRKKLSPNLRYWVSGGARLDPVIAQFFRDLGISLRQGYGLTETSPVVCVQEAFPDNLDSVGYAIEGVTVKIDNPDELGSGEVLVKGDNVMLGYSDESATQEVMTDGWFRTGDLGRLDSSGNLSLTGRIKRTIITEGGKNVYPEELESLLERYPDVKEAGIVEFDNRPCAVFAMENPETGAARAKQILKDFNTKASAHNHITRCAVVEDLPKTPLGKTALSKLPEVFESYEVR